MTTDPLAALLHDSMPDEHNWRLFFGREDDEDGWWLVIKRDLSVYLADRLRAHGVTTDDRLRDRETIARWLGKSGYVHDWDHALVEADALLTALGAEP